MSPGTGTIPHHAMLACEPFSERLDAARVAAALASGLAADGSPAPDSVLLPEGAGSHDTAALLQREDFHARMLASRAVIIAVPALAERTLEGSAAFEIATLARQSGVPCYAAAAAVELNTFDLRILDLQMVVRARGEAGLRTAGEKLAGVI